jgi:hypothetical protein
MRAPRVTTGASGVGAGWRSKTKQLRTGTTKRGQEVLAKPETDAGEHSDNAGGLAQEDQHALARHNGMGESVDHPAEKEHGQEGREENEDKHGTLLGVRCLWLQKQRRASMRWPFLVFPSAKEICGSA